MRERNSLLGGLVWVAIAGLLSAGPSAARAGEIDVHLYGDFGLGAPIEGTAIEDLTSDDSFPDNPTLTSTRGELPPLTEALAYPEPFEKTDAAGDSYGLMAEGYLEVPTTGDWKFFIASDDAGQFELNPNGHDPAGAQIIAEEPECCNEFMDDGVRSSDALSLEKGVQYYFRVLMKEGGGSDWVEAGWQGPGMDSPERIPGHHLQRFVTETGDPVITRHPEDLTVSEESPEALFSVAVDALPPVEYQWHRNGEPIEGEVNSTLVFDASLENDGDTYSVEVNGVESATATLSVTPDTTAPVVEQASPRGNPNGVTIFFSEAVSEETALNADNYSIDDGSVPIDSVEFFQSDRAVRLNTGGDGFEVESDHTLVVQDIEDRSAGGNVVDPNPTNLDFSFGKGITFFYDFDDGAPEGLDLFGSADVLSSGGPDGSGILELTPAEGSQQGTARFEEVGTVEEFEARFQARLGDGTDLQADGFSFNVASDLPEGLYAQVAEDGGGTDLSIAFDNWDNGDGETEGTTAPAIDILWGRGVVASEPMGTQDDSTLDTGDEWVDVLVRVDADGVTTVEYREGDVIHDSVVIEDWEPIEDARVGLGARTGGSNSTHWIDNLEVTVGGGEVGPVDIAEGGQPEDQVAPENETVTFEVEASGALPHFFQWFQNGEPIEGATSRELATPEVTPENDGDTFHVVVSNEFSEVESEEAVLTVEEDTTPPEVDDITVPDPSFESLQLTFSERVTAESAENTENYSLSGGLSVEGATLQDDRRTVLLQTSQQDPNTAYTITVRDVADIAGAENTLEEIELPWHSWGERRFGVLWEAYTGITGTAVAGLTGADKFPDNPDVVRSLEAFDMGGGGEFFGDNYGARMTAEFIPPETGDYRFFIRSDDASQLFISLDGTESGLTSQPIAEETACCAAFQPVDDPRTSDPFSLTEGEPVLLRFLMKEGGGGDWGQVAFRMEGDPTPPGGLSPIGGQHLRALRPVANQPVVRQQTPADGAIARDVVSQTPLIEAVLQDGAVVVDEGTIELTVAGQTVSPEITREDDLVFVRHRPEESLGAFREIPVSLGFEDANGNAVSSDWQFETGPLAEGTRFIEAEDYNHGEGQWVEGGNGGPTGEPYEGGAYEGLEGVNGIDFNDDGGGGGEPAYRFDTATEVPGPATVAFEAPSDTDRGTFTVESNWKVGWTGEGEWYNYTRDFPEEETTYDVFARISSGGTDPDPILHRVTSDPSQPDQETEELGQFSGPASGDWGTAIFYRMHEVDNPDQPAQATLSGENTLRLTVGPGNMDIDYMAFVPAEPVAPPPGDGLTISLSEGTVTIEWEDEATLETAPEVSGPWEASDQDSPASFPVDEDQALFFRTVE